MVANRGNGSVGTFAPKHMGIAPAAKKRLGLRMENGAVAPIAQAAVSSGEKVLVIVLGGHHPSAPMVLP